MTKPTRARNADDVAGPLSPTVATKRDELLDLLRSYGSCVVAFSGGLDSALLAKAAQLALGDRAAAVTAVSASLAVGELDEARQLTTRIGIRHDMIETAELSLAAYCKNTADRCYHCKSELFSRVGRLAAAWGMAVVVDGSNQDDRSEHRPGHRAASEQKVRSPLAVCKFTKPEIRALAEHWGLSVHNKPATPCLSSRIAYGESITIERLAMVDRAERFLRDLGFSPLRVRYHKGDVARIEVPADVLSRFADEALRDQVVAELKEAGFKYVALDLEGFRSGSLNVVLPTESLEILDP